MDDIRDVKSTMDVYKYKIQKHPSVFCTTGEHSTNYNNEPVYPYI